MCPLMPYSPLHPSEKPVSHEKMLEILAKRTNQPVGNDARSAGLTPQPDAVSRDMAERRQVDGGSPINTPAVGFAPEAGVVAVAPLQWSKPIWYEPGVVGCVMSDCGRYRVDKCGSLYTAWRKAQSRDHLNLRLGEVESLKLAEGLCRADLGCDGQAGAES